MKSLQRRFEKIALENPYWSSYISFAEAVRNQGFSKRRITSYFNSLVDKDDYDKRDKKKLIQNLLSLSQKIAEEGMF